ncbi:MAG: adenylate/guanylate cyclase domain-containing protein [Saprospiraceae bacterium]|nr:adenylate/guanylate cyclase domain-containing protein [Saprospiraceae bacterium]
MTRQRIRIRKLEKLLDLTNAKLEKLQVNFGRFTPEEVIEHLTEADGTYRPAKRKVTVLFADLVGFTRMSREQDPEVVVSVLNGYFKRMNEVITRHHGQITELLGDGILAMFGALSTNPWQIQDAVQAALGMREALVDYNEELRAQDRPELQLGIGIHHGEVLVGIMGTMELSKFGVVGDTINIAARVEALTRQHQIDILVTEEVRQALDQRFIVRPLQPTPIKGLVEPIVTYYVEAMLDAKVPDQAK